MLFVWFLWMVLWTRQIVVPRSRQGRQSRRGGWKTQNEPRVPFCVGIYLFSPPSWQLSYDALTRSVSTVANMLSAAMRAAQDRPYVVWGRALSLHHLESLSTVATAQLSRFEGRAMPELFTSSPTRNAVKHAAAVRAASISIEKCRQTSPPAALAASAGAKIDLSYASQSCIPRQRPVQCGQIPNHECYILCTRHRRC